MIPDDIQALALADAIGALDADERRELEVRLAELPTEVRAQVADLYSVTVLLAASAPARQPPPELRAAVLAKATAPSNYTVTAAGGAWIQTPVPGLEMKVLALDKPRDRVTLILRAQPGVRYPAHRHTAPEECYVISGSVFIEGRLLRAGDFHHAEGHSDHGEIRTDEGVEVLLVAAASDYLSDLA